MRKLIVLSLMFSLPVLATRSEADATGRGERQVALRGGDNMAAAYMKAVASGAPTAIRMTSGTLHVRPRETPRYELTTGHEPASKHGVRAAHSIAWAIKLPVAVTRQGVHLGEVDGHSTAAEQAIVDKLNISR